MFLFKFTVTSSAQTRHREEYRLGVFDIGYWKTTGAYEGENYEKKQD